jgi:hypothetical protein
MSSFKIKAAQDYTHIQSTASDLWDIDYKMDLVPIVEILIDNNGQLEKMLPMTIERVSNRRIKVYFSQPFAGEAHIVG